MAQLPEGFKLAITLDTSKMKTLDDMIGAYTVVENQLRILALSGWSGSAAGTILGNAGNSVGSWELTEE